MLFETLQLILMWFSTNSERAGQSFAFNDIVHDASCESRTLVEITVF